MKISDCSSVAYTVFIIIISCIPLIFEHCVEVFQMI